VTLDVRRKRLLFRACHRGTREIEFMLGRFAEGHVADLDDHQLDRLESLIEECDADLFAWISAKSAIPPAHDHDVMHLIQKFNKYL
jgi:antitoxin CptB